MRVLRGELGGALVRVLIALAIFVAFVWFSAETMSRYAIAVERLMGESNMLTDIVNKDDSGGL